MRPVYVSEEDRLKSIVTIFEKPEDSSEIETMVESLLFVLQEVRAGKLQSVAIIGLSDDGKISLSSTAGVRDDMIPTMIGHLEIMKSELFQERQNAIEFSEQESDPA